MLNKVILIGRLTKDPELRYTPNGVAVATFTIAVDRGFTNQQGQKEVDFIRIVVWKKMAEIVANNLGKGRLVAIEGRLQIRNYDTPDGQKRQVSEVVASNVKFLDWPKDQQSNGDYSRPQSQQDTDFSNDGFNDSDFDFPGDDLPF